MSKDHSGCTHSATRAATRACEVTFDRQAVPLYEFYVNYATAKGVDYGEWHQPHAHPFLEERFGVKNPETDRLRGRLNIQLVAAGWIEQHSYNGVQLRLVPPDELGYDPLLGDVQTS